MKGTIPRHEPAVFTCRGAGNPAQGLENLLPKLPKKAQKHHEALPYADIPAFMAKLATHQEVPARALEFLILTAARTGEVRGATWDEIDLTEKVWAIPAERMKADKPHRVPLSDQALALLQHLPREEGNPFVFIGTRHRTGIGPLVLARQLERITHNGDTVHGMRSTFSDWAHERTNHSNHVIEQSLAHSVGNAVERAYRRGDLFEKRRRLMADWARYCSTPAADTGNVVAINR